VKLVNAICRFSTNAAALSVASGATVIAVSSKFGFASSGVAVVDAKFTGTSCDSYRSLNDGYNVSGTTGECTLNNSIGAYNGDEGASAHSTCRLTVSGGRYHHNVHAGINSIENSVQNLDGVTCDYNGTGGGSNQAIAGIAFVQSCTGTVSNCVCQNNAGAGFYSTSAVPPTVTNLTSGLGQGNGLADVGP
jgi:hypothetical protein